MQDQFIFSLYNVLKRNVMPMVEVVSISIKWGVFVVLLGVFTHLVKDKIDSNGKVHWYYKHFATN